MSTIKETSMKVKRSFKKVSDLGESKTPCPSMKSWVETRKSLLWFNQRASPPSQDLDETYEAIENVPGLNVILYPTQQRVIKAMCDLENNRTTYDNCTPYGYGTCNVRVTTSAGVMSDPVGSGKTFSILGVILTQKLPKVVADICNIRQFPISTSENILEGIFTNYYGNITAASTIRRRFSSILKPTLIFVGKSVLGQWETTIKTYTDPILNVFTVRDVRDLQNLLDKMSSKIINRYNIVLVKNSKVSRGVDFPDDIICEDKNKISGPYIYNIISNMRTYCWGRVVVDDVDVIGMPHNAGVINALFTWYISSTQKTMRNKSITTTKQFTKTSDMLLHADYGCGRVMNNKLLFDYFNVKCTKKFIQDTINLKTPRVFNYIFINKSDSYMKLLTSIGDDEAEEIVEMLNGDAIETAAERAGIKTDNVGDIFRQILGKHYYAHRDAEKVLDFMDSLGDIKSRLPYTRAPKGDTYGKKDLMNGREIKYNYPALKSLLETTREEQELIHRRTGVALKRVKDNFIEGKCIICRDTIAKDSRNHSLDQDQTQDQDPPSDSDSELEELAGFADILLSESDKRGNVILKCCGSICCATCCFSIIFDGSKQKLKSSACPMCRQEINVKDIIYINAEMDLETIITSTVVKESKKEKDIDGSPSNVEERSKILAVIELIKGIIPKEKKEVNFHENSCNLIQGQPDSLPFQAIPPEIPRKIIIYANFKETTNLLVERFNAEKIEYLRLDGTADKMEEAAKKFQSSKSAVLLFDKHCAGRNLQTATDIVFMHSVRDNNNKTQALGRAYRIGRTSRLHVHNMYYENEQF